MNAKRLINFHYNHSTNPQVPPVYYLPSQHVVTMSKVLKFTYQNTSQKPIVVERVASIPIVSYAPSVSQAQYRPQQSVQSSTKIKLVTKKNQRGRALSNAMPQCSSTELQEDQKIRNRLKTQRQQAHDDNSSVRNSNPEAAYTYKLRNHIQAQPNHKPYCQLFSVCIQPDEQDQREQYKSAKETTISQQVKCSSKEQRPFSRLPIFQSNKISQFLVQEGQKINQYESIQYESKPEPAQMLRDYIIFNKIASEIPQNRSFRRKSLFEALQPPPRQNMITVLQESIDLNDIPDVISKNWQNSQPPITQWRLQSQSNQSYSKQRPQFKHFQ